MLVNEDGKTIPEGSFNFTTGEVSDNKGIGTKGVLKYPSKSSIEVGETVLFISNRDGESDRFKIIYELDIPFEQRAGNYTTRINYSLFEIEM